MVKEAWTKELAKERCEISFGGRMEKIKKEIECWEKEREDDYDDSRFMEGETQKMQMSPTAINKNETQEGQRETKMIQSCFGGVNTR